MSTTPPGPKGEPLFGSSRTYARDPFRFISALERAYGDVARFDMGPMDTVMLCDPTAIERVLVSEADRFRKPDFREIAGERWVTDYVERRRRRGTERSSQTPAFSMGDCGDGRPHHRRRGGPHRRLVHGDVIDAEQSMTRARWTILDLMMGVELSDQRVRTTRSN
ncbi:hypothetical protein C9J85_00365 [Haloferax sp. wsp5]|nr:hypothetical protein C9J85_00365 [Haloferax sp. wsp5]